MENNPYNFLERQTCKPIIGEDGRPGSGRWCVHCTCGWSGTLPSRTVYSSQDKAREVWDQHVTEIYE